MSIVDHSRQPTIDLTIFPETLPGPYWSSTPTRSPLGRMLFVEFGSGRIDYGDKAAASNVHCVRG